MAGCDNCGYWVHDMCDPLAAIALEAEDESEVPYYCPPCKRQAEAGAKLATLRAAEAQLRAAQPQCARMRMPASRRPPCLIASDAALRDPQARVRMPQVVLQG